MQGACATQFVVRHPSTARAHKLQRTAAWARTSQPSRATGTCVVHSCCKAAPAACSAELCSCVSRNSSTALLVQLSKYQAQRYGHTSSYINALQQTKRLSSCTRSTFANLTRQAAVEEKPARVRAALSFLGECYFSPRPRRPITRSKAYSTFFPTMRVESFPRTDAASQRLRGGKRRVSRDLGSVVWALCFG